MTISSAFSDLLNDMTMPTGLNGPGCVGKGLGLCRLISPIPTQIIGD